MRFFMSALFPGSLIIMSSFLISLREAGMMRDPGNEVVSCHHIGPLQLGSCDKNFVT